MLGLFSAAATKPADAAVTVDVNITVNGITILYYYNVVNVTLDATALGGLMGVSGCTGTVTSGVGCVAAAPASGTATFAAGTLSLNATAPNNPAPGSLSNVPLQLKNVWAVRAISNTAGGNVTVTVGLGTGANTTLNGPGAGNSILLTSAGAQAAAAAVTFAPPGLVTARPGDVFLGLDLTNAKVAGTYTTTAGADANYTIDVTTT